MGSYNTNTFYPPKGVTGIVPIESGGTNSDTVSGALVNLGLDPASTPTFGGATVNGIVQATEVQTSVFIAPSYEYPTSGEIDLNMGAQNNGVIVPTDNNITLSAIGLSDGQTGFFLIKNQTGDVVTITVPTGWVNVGGTTVTSLADGTNAILELRAYGPNDTDVISRWTSA